MRKRWVAAAVVAMAVGSGRHSLAGPFAYDLRFATGDPKERAVGSGGASYDVNIWLSVTGADGNADNDGLQSGFLSILSRPVGASAMTDGGIVSNSLNSAFTNAGSAAGTAGIDVNGDGVTDLGTAVTNFTAANQAPPRMAWRGNSLPPVATVATPTFRTSPGVTFNATDSNTTEFLLGTFTVAVDHVSSGGITVLEPVIPSSLAWITYPVAGTVDGITERLASTGTITPGVSDATPSGSGVTFHTPEPSACALLTIGLAAAGFRRRR